MECNVFEEGGQYGDSIVQAIAPRGQNSGGGCFLQFLVADRRVHYRSPRIVEVHAPLSGSGSLCLGSCGCPNHRLGDLARLASEPTCGRLISHKVHAGYREENVMGRRAAKVCDQGRLSGDSERPGGLAYGLVDTL